MTEIKIFDFIKRNKEIFVAALLVLTISSYFIYDYTQNNPKFCITCHLMNEAYETWEECVMHDIECHNCHESNMLESLDHVREVLFENPKEVTKPTVIENTFCEECHANNDPQLLQVENTAGHEVHLFTQETEPECIGCHGLQLHVFEASEETCLQCHSPDYDAACEVMDIYCTVCHEFTATDHGLIPQTAECLRCHEGQQNMGVSFPSGAHNDTACDNCHNPHIENQIIECVTCHTEILGGGLHTVSAHDDCNDCHVPHSLEPMSDGCLSCHVDKTEHFGTAECSVCHGFATPIS